jgi:hypothetical protein
MSRYLILLAYVGLLVLGWILHEPILVASSALVQTINPQQAETMIWSVAGIYALVSAIPFVPGAELGIALLVAFGGRVALLVYASTVISLTAAYSIGRLIPARLIGSFFKKLGLRRAGDLVTEVDATPPNLRIDYLSRNAPTGWSGTLLRYRYLALALAFNIPGNTLIGGGGGIAMVAGMTRMFSFGWFLLAVMIAVAPVPLLVFLFGFYA